MGRGWCCDFVFVSGLGLGLGWGARGFSSDDRSIERDRWKGHEDGCLLVVWSWVVGTVRRARCLRLSKVYEV